MILGKNHVLGIATQEPSTLLAIDVDQIFPDKEEKTRKQKPSSVSPGLLARIPRTPSGEAGEPSEVPAASMEDIEIAHLSAAQQLKVCALLAKFAKMWDSSLGKVKAASQRIETAEDSHPFRAQPYRAGSKQRELIES